MPKYNNFIAVYQIFICALTVFDDLSRSSSHLFADNFVLVVAAAALCLTNGQHKVDSEKVRR